jgi:DNA-binding NarL/FixJ family response regulator
MKTKIKVAIAEDQSLFRKGFMALLGDTSNIRFVLEAENGIRLLEGLEKMKSKLPDVIFMDIEMPEMDGFSATEEIVRKYPQIKILALTMHNADDFILQMHRNGAHGFLTKDADIEEVLDAVDMVMNKGKYYNERSMRVLLDNAEKVLKSSSRTGVLAYLSQREIDVLRLLCSEQTNTQIAENLNLSVRTVEWHRRNIYSKLNLRNIAGLTKFAMDNGIL